MRVPPISFIVLALLCTGARITAGKTSANLNIPITQVVNSGVTVQGKTFKGDGCKLSKNKREIVCQ